MSVLYNKKINMILCAALLLSGLEGKLFCFHFLRSNTPLEFYDILFILFFSLSLEISSFFFSNVKFGVSSYLAERLRTYVRTYVMGVLEIIFGCNLGQKFSILFDWNNVLHFFFFFFSVPYINSSGIIND